MNRFLYHALFLYISCLSSQRLANNILHPLFVVSQNVSLDQNKTHLRIWFMLAKQSYANGPSSKFYLLAGIFLKDRVLFFILRWFLNTKHCDNIYIEMITFLRQFTFIWPLFLCKHFIFKDAFMSTSEYRKLLLIIVVIGTRG